ncbi:MAG: stage II sporulation protein [candidate division TM6 bacterium GW2011_GWF2_32_72]|nr:MAG: stage II sporulation protein [candidate division TM6 bacterium GW2011_GWF2_32_72]
MNKSFFFKSFFFLIFFSALGSGNIDGEKDVKDFKFNVRVLLDEISNKENKCWELSADQGFILIDPDDVAKKVYLKQKKIFVKWNKGTLFFDGKKFLRDSVKIYSLSDGIALGTKNYQGGFFFVKDKEKSYLINELDLEDYLYAVLCSEVWPGWPLEMNKVQAIASRSYVVSKVLESKKNKKFYHIKDDNFHQRYNMYGFQGKEAALKKVEKKAIDETKGLILSHKGKPILAMFDACCGGVIPSKLQGLDFEKAPYLKREHACQYCKGFKVFNWQFEMSKNDLASELRKVFPDLANLVNFKITKRDKADTVQEIQIKDSKHHTFVMTGKKFYKLLGNVKSFCFSSQCSGKKYIFKGKGLGHHIGLCQWGAKKMVDDGYDFESILSFYYPNTKIMKLASTK